VSTSRSYAVPATIVTGSDVQLPPGPVVTLREPSLPPLAYDVEPEDDQPSGDDPLEDASKDPFRILLPSTKTDPLALLFDSSSSAIALLGSTWTATEWSPVAWCFAFHVSDATVTRSPAASAAIVLTAPSCEPSTAKRTATSCAAADPSFSTVTRKVT
jgi:hypothetical protein